MADTQISTTNRYDIAARGGATRCERLATMMVIWAFCLRQPGLRAANQRVIDVGSGTGAFAEAWVAIHGPPRELTLLEPSAAMLERGKRH